MNKLFFIFLLVSINTFANAIRLPISSTKNKVSFKAVANPGFLSILGESKNTLQGEIRILSKDVKGEVTLPLESLETGIALRNEHMKKKYLEIEKYPNAQFVFSQMQLPEGINTLESEMEDIAFKGTLTLHGKSAPISGLASLERKDNVLDLSFRFDTSIQDFDIEQPGHLGVTVGNKISVIVTIEGKI